MHHLEEKQVGKMKHCDDCDLWGKGWNWQEDNCPKYGSGSYSISFKQPICLPVHF